MHHERLKEIDTNINKLKKSLASASPNMKDLIIQDIEKWMQLRGTIQRSLENKSKCDKYIQDEGLNFGASRRSQPDTNKLATVHKEQSEAHQNLQRAAQSADERRGAISQLQEFASSINAAAADCEQAARENAESEENYFSSSFLHFFRAICCCGSSPKESQPLINSDEPSQPQTYG